MHLHLRACTVSVRSMRMEHAGGSLCHSLCSAGGFPSSATVFPSHTPPAPASSHQPGNSVFLSQHSSSSLQLQPAERNGTSSPGRSMLSMEPYIEPKSRLRFRSSTGQTVMPRLFSIHQEQLLEVKSNSIGHLQQGRAAPSIQQPRQKIRMGMAIVGNLMPMERNPPRIRQLR